MRHNLMRFPIMLCLLLSTPSLALAASFVFTTIDVPGASGTRAHAINQSGQIVGSFDDASGTHGFLKDGTNFIPFDVPGAFVTDPLGINNAGQIVGRFEDATGLHGFLKDGTSIITFDFPGAVSTEAAGINDLGQIVGNYFLGASGTHGVSHAYLKEGTSFTTIDPPGASFAGAGGINDLGQIAGIFSDGSRVHGFLKDGASFTTIDVPGSSFTGAHGINDGGQIVGEYRSTVDAPSHGFLKDGTNFITFDVPGAVRTEAYGINGCGQIVGLVLDANDRFHGFLATSTVDCQGPVTSNVSAAPNPVAVNTVITLTALVNDTTTGGATIAAADYNIDGGNPILMAAQDTAFDEVSELVVAAVPAFPQAGVHEICVDGTDAVGNIGPAECIFLAVYDPTAGFVTGGGWIDSPEGAYTPDPLLVGKANFGFVSKYQKGATTPTGVTEFQFKVAGLNFHSDIYEWLVVAGARAQYKGTGTINGLGNYGFMLTAIDGQVSGGGGTDKFRIKIWDKAQGDLIVYDNQLGDSDSGNPTTVVGGGSIVIHQK